MKKSVMMNYLSEIVHSVFENRKPQPIPEGITVEELVDIAKRGQIQYIVLSALLKLDLQEETLNSFRPHMFRSTMKTLTQVCMIKDIHAKLEAAGIRHQVLKGAVMKNIYPSPEMREMGDIDVMIYENTLDKAEEVFKDMGFVKYRLEKHHVIFNKPPYLVLEAHWTLYDQNVDKGQFMYYKNNFRAELVEGTEYTYDFSREDFYVYMISHMAKHFYETGCGVRNVLDVYVYNKAYKDVLKRDVIEAELKKLGLAEFEKHVEKLSRVWLDGEESTEFYNNLFEYMLDCGIYGKGENGVWGQLAKTHTDVKERKKDVLKSYIFPPLSYMRDYYEWVDKMPWLLPVGWVVRGIHALTDKTVQERARNVANVEEEQVSRIGSIYKELNLNFKG